MIADRVQTMPKDEDTSTFPGGLVALQFPKKQDPVQMFFVEDTSLVDMNEFGSAVKVNFAHNLESGEECKLSISFD